MSLISIIVPIYNAEKYLDKCIQSIINQTYRNIEIILVNDGSTDGSSIICEKYRKEDSRIRIYSQENEGLLETRKRSVGYASGDIIGFVDSDDWIEPEMISELVNICLKYNCDLVSSGIIREYSDGRIQEVCDCYEEGLYTDPSKEIFPKMLYNTETGENGLYCTLVNKLFKKRYLQQVLEKIDTRVFYGEDALVLYNYCLIINNIYILKKSFYHYIIRQGSMCRRDDVKLLENQYWLYQGLKNGFERHKDSYVLMRQLKNYIVKINRHMMQRVFHVNLGALDDWKIEVDERILNQRYVIYGAGACGQALYAWIEKKKKLDNLTAWIDKNPENKWEECLYDVQGVDHLNTIDCQYIIIAIQNREIQKKVGRMLTEDFKITKDKIIFPDFVN